MKGALFVVVKVKTGLESVDVRVSWDCRAHVPTVSH
jgi:hypothetical protein